MSNTEEDHAREVLLEAFTAGWQAALAVTISNPRVLAMVESCFELWLAEAVDERDVLGLPFRGRGDLPAPVRGADGLLVRPGPRVGTQDTSTPAPRGPIRGNRQRAAAPSAAIPAQRSPSEGPDGALVGPSEPKRRRVPTGRHLRRR